MFFVSCGGESPPVNTSDEYQIIWDQQIQCVYDELTRTGNIFNRDLLPSVLMPDNQEVDFQLADCGGSDTVACTWVFFARCDLFDGIWCDELRQEVWQVGVSDGEPIFYIAGVDTPIREKGNSIGIVLVLYEQGQFRVDTIKHENMHVILSQIHLRDDEHISKWFRNEICM